MSLTIKYFPILLIFCGFLYVQGNYNFFETFDKEAFQKIVEECKEIFNITDEVDISKPDSLQSANDTSENPENVQCFVHCIVNKTHPEAILANGSLIAEKVGLDVNDKDNENLLECLRMDGKDTCETTFKQFTCYVSMMIIKIIADVFKGLAKNLGIEVDK